MNTLKYFLLATMLTFAGCAEDGAPGPKGDQGEQGPQGEQGEAGTANVMYSEWVTPDWSVNSSVALEWFINDENLTEEVASQGLAIMYARKNFRGATSIYNYPNDYLDFSFTFRAYKPENSYNIYLRAVSGEPALLESLKTDYQFRYILVPGSVLTGGRKAAPVDYSDYQAVKEYYNIPD